MRSRREEYAQRFEELTKQEIKNYNDSLLATHVSLEEFRRKLKECVDLYAQQVAQLSSQIKTVEAENRDLRDEIHGLSRKLQSQIHDFNKLETESAQDQRKRIQVDKSLEKEMRDNYNFLLDLRDSFTEEFVSLKSCVNSIYMSIENVYRQSKSDNEKLKEEILSLPSEAKKVKKELLEKIAISAVDNEGLLREVAIVKKKSGIQESKNQYFHTQIDRLKTKMEG